MTIPDNAKCGWCRKKYSEHDDELVGGSIPKVPCLLLKSNFLYKEQSREDAQTKAGEESNNNEVN